MSSQLNQFACDFFQEIWKNISHVRVGTAEIYHFINRGTYNKFAWGIHQFNVDIDERFLQGPWIPRHSQCLSVQCRHWWEVSAARSMNTTAIAMFLETTTTTMASTSLLIPQWQSARSFLFKCCQFLSGKQIGHLILLAPVVLLDDMIIYRED